MKDLGDSAESWSKKRIIIGSLILATLVGGVYFGKASLFDQGIKGILGSVKGISTVKESTNNESKNRSSFLPQSPKAEVQEQLDSIKERVNNLNVSDMATSSPYVQKIVDDLKNLQQLPKDQAREACFNFCKGL